MMRRGCSCSSRVQSAERRALPITIQPPPPPDRNTADSTMAEVCILLMDLTKGAETASEGRLDSLLHRLGKHRCYHARCLLGDKPSSIDEGVLEKEVRRFVRVKDRYLALTSVLLKSRIFLDSFPWLDRYLVLLPRTRHRKPYIPVVAHSPMGDDPTEVSALPFSLSHQWPFIGISRLMSDLKEKHHVQRCLDRSSHLVGFDVVVFEKVNLRLYKDDEEFMQVFKESFSPKEWRTIQSFRGRDGYLEEFYLNWAVKEAYTKALGVGLGFDFASFQIEWDDGCVQGDSLWKTLHTSVGRGASFVASGVVVQVEKDGHTKSDKKQERWLFKFVLLREELSRDFLGASCACVGPFSVDSPVSSLGAIVWRVEWLELSELLLWYDGK